ncbi:MAG: hypothetical protein ACYCZR_00660, partial [Burkholderiales bacterium]
ILSVYGLSRNSRKFPNPGVSVPEIPDLPIGIGKREEIGKTSKGGPFQTPEGITPGERTGRWMRFSIPRHSFSGKTEGAQREIPAWMPEPVGV